MPFYSNEEAYDMLRVYFESLQNAVIAEREYAVRYPERRSRSRKVFTRLARRVRETGNVQPISVRNRLRRSRNEENIINVLAYVETEPHLSIRVIARDLGLNYTLVNRILKDYKMHPYHVILQQELKEADFDRRLDYCNWLKGMFNDDPDFLSKILWTDEATFSGNGKVNLHNSHYWSKTNPHWQREVSYQNRWSLNVWCGILNGRIIGPFFFERRLSGENYLEFLINDLPILLEDIPIQNRLDMWYQQDGCPPHFAANVRHYLDAAFPDRWIGRGSIFPWPARSPDLTVLDFYLWGRIKDLVFKTRPTTPEDMKDRIRQAVQSISVAEIESSVSSTIERLDLCIANDGKHFEYLK